MCVSTAEKQGILCLGRGKSTCIYTYIYIGVYDVRNEWKMKERKSRFMNGKMWRTRGFIVVR